MPSTTKLPIVLVVDAVPDQKMRGVVFYRDGDAVIYASSTVSKRHRRSWLPGK